MKKKEESSELVNIAATLEAELRRFETLAEEVRDSPLQSQKHLERMARALQEVADCDERLVANVRALLAALNSRRDLQTSLAGEVNAKALELQARTQTYQELMQRFGGLGQEAGKLSADVQTLFASVPEGGAQARAAELVGALQQVNDRMQQVADNAQSLAQDAHAQGFFDVSRDADSLRQQLLSARNRANLLQQKLHPASA
jgi:DNA repair exonuclease SbcCD ATPase subunit